MLLARIPLPVGACVQPAGAHPKGVQALNHYGLPGPALLLCCRSRVRRDGVWRRATRARRRRAVAKCALVTFRTRGLAKAFDFPNQAREGQQEVQEPRLIRINTESIANMLHSMADTLL